MVRNDGGRKERKETQKGKDQVSTAVLEHVRPSVEQVRNVFGTENPVSEVLTESITAVANGADKRFEAVEKKFDAALEAHRQGVDAELNKNAISLQATEKKAITAEKEASEAKGLAQEAKEIATATQESQESLLESFSVTIQVRTAEGLNEVTKQGAEAFSHLVAQVEQLTTLVGEMIRQSNNQDESPAQEQSKEPKRAEREEQEQEEKQPEAVQPDQASTPDEDDDLDLSDYGI